MRMEFGRADQQVIVDVVPRTAAALEEYGPRGSMAFRDQARAETLLKDVTARGGRATLGKAIVRFDRIPPPFDQILSEIEGEISVQAQPDAKPLAARIVAETDEGNATFDIDLQPTSPERDWDVKFAGQRNGVTFELRFVWRHDEAHGSAQLTWRFTRASGPAAERAQALALIVALHGKGKFSVTDREDEERAMSQQTTRRRVPSGLRALRDAYQNLADIQSFAGTTFGRPPDEFSGQDAHNLAYLADLLRRGRVDGNVTSAKMIVDAQGLAQLRLSGSDIEVRENLIADLFGREVVVAERVMHLPLMQIHHATHLPDGNWEVELVPTTGNDAAMEIEFRPPAKPPYRHSATDLG